MTLVIVLFVREGIVMASDSRITLNATSQQKDQKIVQLDVGLTDSVYKTFLTPGNVGISAFGAADIRGVPIAGFIDSFINEHLSQSVEVDEVPRELLTYFRSLPYTPDTGFLVAGYKKVHNISEQHVWEVSVTGNSARKLNPEGEYGASWRGEQDVLIRLLQPVGLQKEEMFQPLPHYPIQFGFFTLQDAIDYSIYAIRVTIDTMRFHTRPKTVGGSIDVLVIKPNESFWVQRKVLHV